MNVRRSKIHIFIDILRLVNRKGKTKPTHILYGANLSHIRLKKYLEVLLANRFIEQVNEDGHVFYTLTQRGLEFLSEFRKVEKVSEAFGIPI